MTLPEAIISEVLNDLKCYDKTNITYSNGKHDVSTGIYLMDKYPTDYKFIGTVYQDDIYTQTERIENYINCFYDYPQSYNGKRDYTLINKMSNDRTFTADTMTIWQGKLNANGNFELTHQKAYKL